MTLKERVRNWLSIPAPAPAAKAAPSNAGMHPPAHLAGQRLRVSQDNPQMPLLSGFSLLAPLDPEGRWRGLSLDDLTLDKITTAELLELLSNLSPEISLALWNLLRLGNPGWEVAALQLTGEEVDTRAQAAVDAFLAVLKERHGSADVVINRLLISAFLRGAFFAELVLDNAGRMPLDIATPDAQWVRFRAQPDPQLGPTWEPFQYQLGVAVSLLRPTIRYVPVDPFPGVPYGRPIAQPAMFTALFTIGLLHDLERVVKQQGYPRIDLEVIAEKLMATMPPDLATDPKAARDWLDEVINEVRRVYRALQPDDAYVHTDVIQVNRPVGTVDSSSLGGIGPLMEMLERQAMRALKSSPLLMGLSGSSNETQSNRQYELVIQGTKSLQHLLEGMLEHLFTLALQAQGLQARVKCRFAECRAAELLRDAQVDALKAQNAALKFARGWISQDEAAQEGAGVDKADQAEPRIPSAGITGGGGATPPAQVQAEPGSQKQSPLTGTRDLIESGNGSGALP